MKPNCDDCNYEGTKFCKDCTDFSNFSAMSKKRVKTNAGIYVYQDRLGDDKHPNMESAHEHIRNIIQHELAIYVYDTEEEHEEGEASETYVVDISSIKFKKENE